MALINALYIDDAYFEDNFVLPENVERKNILMAIKQAQSIKIVDLLGTCLYEDIEAKFIAETLSATEEELVEMIKQCLVYHTAHELLELVRSEKSLNGDEQGRDPMSYGAAEKANYWEMRIIRFIKSDEAGLYATATADGCDDFDDINEDLTGSSSGVYYPNGVGDSDSDCTTGIYLKN